MEFETIFDVIAIQGGILKSKSGELVKTLNSIHANIEEITKNKKIVALLFHNLGEHDTFEINLNILGEEMDISPVSGYEMNFNDGESFSLDDYDYREDYPWEDYFLIKRSEYLNNLMFDFFVECYWNSTISESDIPCIYSHTTDCDSLVDLKDPTVEYTDFEFLK